MWNSYISRDIIKTIKSIHSNHSNWFYFRKNNSRMEDENIYTTLAYFQFCRNKKKNNDRNNSYSPEEIDIYKVGSKINFRVKSKNEITRALENSDFKDDFIKAINHLEFDFIRKLKRLLSNDDNTPTATLSKNLDDIFMVGNARRTQQSFYALWYFLFDIPIESIDNSKRCIRTDLKKLFSDMANIEDKLTFEQYVLDFKSQYSISNETKNYETAFLTEIATISIGIKKNNSTSSLTQRNIFENSIKYNYISM
ncbi:hypothetical protein EZS27_028780 [termite gut metagenome]|uniref:DUF262 domain-containing protein n=1 Tax=termite gut metagenome TaxID=433724 RepID=A0A5J4QL13_9ZZZZ